MDEQPSMVVDVVFGRWDDPDAARTGNRRWAYRVAAPVNIGDIVRTPFGVDATVVSLSSDYTGPVDLIKVVDRKPGENKIDEQD